MKTQRGTGYLVEYPDSNPNHPEYKGYISWSPFIPFEEAYRINGELDFGMALKALKEGKRVARSGWNGAGQHLQLEKVHTVTPVRDNLCLVPFISIKTVQDTLVPWLASQTDMLSEDWVIFD